MVWGGGGGAGGGVVWGGVARSQVPGSALDSGGAARARSVCVVRKGSRAIYIHT